MMSILTDIEMSNLKLLTKTSCQFAPFNNQHSIIHRREQRKLQKEWPGQHEVVKAWTGMMRPQAKERQGLCLHRSCMRRHGQFLF